MAKQIAIIGDASDHGGHIITTNQDGTLHVLIGGTGMPVTTGPMWGTPQWGELPEGTFGATQADVAVQGALHSCPITGHGTTPITAVVVRSYHNNRLILTLNATAGCGAKITPPDRKVYVEA